MQDKITKHIEKLQQTFFGKRYVGATLGKLSLPTGVSERIQAWIDMRKNFLVITGPAGTSKTYFCSAMIEIIFNKFETFRAFDERDLLRKLRQGMGSSMHGDYLDHLQQLIDDELIIIDDVGSSGHTEWREEALMEAIDFRYGSTLPTIFTSNLSKKDFYQIYGQRISSRLFAKENTIIDLEGMPDLREEGK